eukprot:CAMPEP_0182811270 /NCGR_PEP_ID=MMETSP0006_2-20121128/8181_1 /TAXON_ID=97485 /ORGANISM="Prymnesium parvum, Strain Texoma1" /LENGTH=44 /DNA_ID= /DNA_START= /DNA_END= /DNA_ORIENTATION=
MERWNVIRSTDPSAVVWKDGNFAQAPATTTSPTIESPVQSPLCR